MPLTTRDRRRLIGESHALSPIAVVSPEAIGDAVVAHVRACLDAHPLAKVRVNADDNATCDAVGAELAARVPCELVKRVGRVLVLHKPPTPT